MRARVQKVFNTFTTNKCLFHIITVKIIINHNRLIIILIQRNFSITGKEDIWISDFFKIHISRCSVFVNCQKISHSLCNTGFANTTNFLGITQIFTGAKIRRYTMFRHDRISGYTFFLCHI